MAERAQSLQDTFLNHVRKNKTPLTIFLINGVKLQGIVTWFDNFCVLLRRDGHSQLVYKHAISTIMPGQPVHLMETEPTEGLTDRHSHLDDARSHTKRAAAAAPPSSAARADARALVLVPLRRSAVRAARRRRQAGAPAVAAPLHSPEDRLEEAVGLAEAIDLDVRASRDRPARRAAAGDAVRLRQGRGDRRR